MDVKRRENGFDLNTNLSACILAPRRTVSKQQIPFSKKHFIIFRDPSLEKLMNNHHFIVPLIQIMI